MLGAHDVAAALILEQNAAGRTIDKLQLQKLLYAVLGVHFELWGEPAFREPMLAYRNGPVVRGVEQTYRDAVPGREPIRQPLGGHPDRVGQDVRDTISIVLARFGDWSGPALERYVKVEGAPWTTARGDLPPEAEGNNQIDTEEIRAWYRTHGSNPSPAYRAGSAEHELLARAAAGDKEAIAALLA